METPLQRHVRLHEQALSKVDEQGLTEQDACKPPKFLPGGKSEKSEKQRPSAAPAQSPIQRRLALRKQKQQDPTLRSILHWHAIVPRAQGPQQSFPMAAPARSSQNPSESTVVLVRCQEKHLPCYERPQSDIAPCLQLHRGALIEVQSITRHWAQLSLREAAYRTNGTHTQLFCASDRLSRFGGSIETGEVYIEKAAVGDIRASAAVKLKKGKQVNRWGDGPSVLSEVCAAISDDVLVAAKCDGYVVVDNVLSPETCALLRAELCSLEENQMMWQSSSYNSANEGAEADAKDPQRVTHNQQPSGINPLLNVGILETSLNYSASPHTPPARSLAPTFDAIEKDGLFMTR